MPLTVAKMAGKTNVLNMEFLGEKVEVAYRSGMITSDWDAKYRGKPDALYQQVIDLVIKWDVVGDNGKPLAVTDANVRTLPLEFLLAVIRACAQDLVPNQQTSEPSGGSFDPA